MRSSTRWLVLLFLGGVTAASAQAPAPPVAPDAPPSSEAQPAPGDPEHEGEEDLPVEPVRVQPDVSDGSEGQADERDTADDTADDTDAEALEDDDFEDAAMDADAELDEDDEDFEVFAPEVTRVTGQRLFEGDRLAGSSHVVDEAELRATQPFSANEILRRVPGVSIRDEDGAGLRPNIGFRGLNPDRSRNLLVLEDGVPVQMGPYGEPELYYAPRLERMRSLEVVKGAAAILYGPRTTGGVLNYVTLDPPEELELRASLQVGNFGTYVSSVSVGDTVGDVGYLLAFTNFRFAGNRGQNVVANDLFGKLRLDLGNGGVLRVKLQGYGEDSNTTYLGLTTEQFEHDPNAQYAENDRFEIRRWAATVGHVVELGERVTLQTTAYFFDLTRNWRRQEYLRSAPADLTSVERVVCGQGPTDLASATDDLRCIYFLNATGNRNRHFTIYGLEPRATVELGEDHQLVVGARGHYESATEQRLVGETPSSSAGRIATYDRRGLYALAAYAQLDLGFLDDRLHIVPGFRFEGMWARRTIYREGGVDLDPAPTSTTSMLAPIPGISVSGQVHESVELFAGMHRGFSPPRIKDSIATNGDVLDLGAEWSWNYELGARVDVAESLHAEAALFYVDFRNQILTPSEASGSSGVSAANGGRTSQWGAEASVSWDPAEQLGFGGSVRMSMPVQLAYTFVDARFRSGWAAGYEGNVVPYAPAHRFSATVTNRMLLSRRHEVEWQVHGDYVASQHADPYNTLAIDADPSGTFGEIPGRFLLDARASYTYVPWGTTFALAAKNLTNREYVASRAPAGIQPGMPLQVLGTLSIRY